VADDALEKAFLSELEALEKFRISYSGQHPNAPLAREDPDVRRLIEAMAMFTARTRLAGQRNIGQSLLRIFRQQFPFLTSPVPAMAILRATPTRRYVDMTEIPSGTEVQLSKTSPSGEETLFHFRTLAKLNVRPLELEAVDIVRVRGQGYKLLLRFTTPFARTEDVGDIRLHVSQLDDLFSSSTVFYELKAHLKQATVIYSDKVREDTRGAPCDVHFDAPRGEPYDLELFEHPLQRARAFVNFPQQALFLEVRGIHPPRNWTVFTLCLEVDEGWPTELRLTPDAFELHAVPMVNIRKDPASPVEYDATKDEHALVHPDRASRFVAHSVIGAFRMTDDGMDPLAPSVLGSGGAGYDVVAAGSGEERRLSVLLNIPGAFMSPERVLVETMWHQPRIAGTRGDELRVKLGDRFVDGVSWSCLGSIAAPVDSALADDRDGLLQLLAIKSQRFLGLAELVVLLRALGADQVRLFSKLVSALAFVNVTPKPFARRSSGFKYVYELSFERLDGSDLAALDLLARRMLEVLTAWSVEEVVEIVAKIPNLGRELRYT